MRKHMSQKASRLIDQAVIAGQMGDRVKSWLLQAYPTGRAKDIARGEGVALNTAKQWLLGKLPENRHMAAMAQRFGQAFVAFVYEPVCGPMRIAVLDSELQDIKQRLGRLQQDIDDATGRRDHRDPDAHAAPVDRQAEHRGGRVVGGAPEGVEAARVELAGGDGR